MESVQWKVDGMSCTNCALSIHKYLQASGIEAPKVSFMDGEVQFDMPQEIKKEILIKGIQKLGYKVRGQEEKQVKKWLDNNKDRALFSFLFTVPLVLRCAYSFANEPLCSTYFNFTRFYTRYVLFWKKRLV